MQNFPVSQSESYLPAHEIPTMEYFPTKHGEQIQQEILQKFISQRVLTEVIYPIVANGHSIVLRGGKATRTLFGADASSEDPSVDYDFLLNSYTPLEQVSTLSLHRGFYAQNLKIGDEALQFISEENIKQKSATSLVHLSEALTASGTTDTLARAIIATCSDLKGKLDNNQTIPTEPFLHETVGISFHLNEQGDVEGFVDDPYDYLKLPEVTNALNLHTDYSMGGPVKRLRNHSYEPVILKSTVSPSYLYLYSMLAPFDQVVPIDDDQVVFSMDSLLRLGRLADRGVDVLDDENLILLMHNLTLAIAENRTSLKLTGATAQYYESVGLDSLAEIAFAKLQKHSASLVENDPEKLYDFLCLTTPLGYILSTELFANAAAVQFTKAGCRSSQAYGGKTVYLLDDLKDPEVLETQQVDMTLPYNVHSLKYLEYLQMSKAENEDRYQITPDQTFAAMFLALMSSDNIPEYAVHSFVDSWNSANVINHTEIALNANTVLELMEKLKSGKSNVH